MKVNLGSIERIPIGEGREFEVCGELIAVFRMRSGDVYATQAMCPHREGPLSCGIVGSGQVICPLHGFKFDLATGQAIANQCESLKTFQVWLTDEKEIVLNLAVPFSRFNLSDALGPQASLAAQIGWLETDAGKDARTHKTIVDAQANDTTRP
jgi:nitrite reductase (NADH) small subunit